MALDGAFRRAADEGAGGEAASEGVSAVVAVESGRGG